jgi:hypothetical protein
MDVTFQGHGVAGFPPLSYTWELSNGFRFFGNPGVLGTASLPAGNFSAQLVVANAYGSGHSLPIFFSIEALRFRQAPSCTALGSNQVRCTAGTEGATEHKWEWGDGSAASWVTGCPGQNPTYTYPAPGTYTVRVRARNCRDPVLVGSPFSVTVTAQAPLSILEFAAVCPLGFCIFDPGEAVPFLHQVSGTPTTYAYDWNGDGINDQVTAAPVLTHPYPAAGTYLPRLTVSRGTEVATAVVPVPLFIQPALPGSEIFSDGFESGDLRSWSLIVTAGGRPDP